MIFALIYLLYCAAAMVMLRTRTKYCLFAPWVLFLAVWLVVPVITLDRWTTYFFLLLVNGLPLFLAILFWRRSRLPLKIASVVVGIMSAVAIVEMLLLLPALIEGQYVTSA